MQSLAIYGIGLMGGSAALAIRRVHPDIRITGYGRSRASLDFALNHAMIDCVGDSRQCPDAEFCLVAAPPQASLAIVRDLEDLGYTGIVTDAVSVKQPVADLAQRPFWQGRLIPAHPIAGTEHHGPQAALPDLYRGSATILTPTADVNSEALARVRQFWSDLGCRLETMSAAEHDKRYAEVSHTPHTLIFALAHLLLSDYSPDELAERSGGGLRGLLRIAASTPEMWRQVLELNRAEVLSLGDRYIQELEHWLNLLRMERGDELESTIASTSAGTRRYLERWQALRDSNS